MAALRLGELESVQQTSRLAGIVVQNGSLEMLSHRGRLRELASEPPKETDPRLRHRSHKRMVVAELRRRTCCRMRPSRARCVDCRPSTSRVVGDRY